MDPERSKELPEPVKKFYRGEPLALGITQILIGIFGILFGVVLNVAYDNRYYFAYIQLMTPYWTGVPYIISGSLCVAAARKPKPSLVKGMLGMNVVSTVAAGIAIILLSASLDFGYWNSRHICSRYSSLEEDPVICFETIMIPHNICVGVMAVLLLFSALEFCISISSAAFGCKAVCNATDTKTIVVVYQNAPPNNPVGLPAAGKDVLNP